MDEIDFSDEKDKIELVWSDNAYLEQKKRELYLVRKTKKLTYFDKYRPSSSFTKATKGTAKITTFMSKRQSIPDDFDEVLDDMENEEQNHQLDLNKRIENLKMELKE